MITTGTFLVSPIGQLFVVVVVGTDSREADPEFPLYNIVKLKGWILSGKGPFEYNKLIEFVAEHKFRLSPIQRL